MSKRLFVLFLLVYLMAGVALVMNGALPPTFFKHLLGSFVAAGIFLSLVFWLSQRLKRIDVVDAAWGPTFIVIALTMYLWQYGFIWDWNISLLYLVLVSLWGGRLSWYITQRIRRSDHEDQRYVELRNKWKGNVALNTYARIFLTQAMLATLISIPVVYTATVGVDILSGWIVAGSIVWLFGYGLEVIADAQLAAFISERRNKGQLMTKGLWRYARYPNYFGEITMWWGIAFISLASPHGWVGFGGAAVITYLIFHVSGIPSKEISLSQRPGWAEHVARTRLLVPLPK